MSNQKQAGENLAQWDLYGTKHVQYRIAVKVQEKQWVRYTR